MAFDGTVTVVPTVVTTDLPAEGTVTNTAARARRIDGLTDKGSSAPRSPNPKAGPNRRPCQTTAGPLAKAGGPAFSPGA